MYRDIDARIRPMHATPSDSGDFVFHALCGHLCIPGLQVDEEGWADVPYVLRALKAEGHILSRFAFERIVMTDPARRFLISADRHRVRAVLPHAVEANTVAGMAAAE